MGVHPRSEFGWVAQNDPKFISLSHRVTGGQRVQLIIMLRASPVDLAPGLGPLSFCCPHESMDMLFVNPGSGLLHHATWYGRWTFGDLHPRMN